MEESLVNKEYLLEKFPGKGGWTYVAIPEVLQDKHAPFGWVRVKGSIDNYQFKNYHLMPMATVHFSFPLKLLFAKQLARRKAIGCR